MDFEEIFLTLPWGWLSKGEAELLWRASGKCTGPILEIGCYKGRSSVLLASHGRQVYCVDPFLDFEAANIKLIGEEAYNAWERNTAHLNNLRLEKITIESWVPLPCGFCYLDGDHSFFSTIHQIEAALATRPQAIAMHDLNMPEVSAASACIGLCHERAGNLGVWYKPGLVF